MKKILFNIFLLFFTTAHSTSNIKLFQNLNEINEFVTKLEEHPLPNNKNWSKPDYSFFYKKQEKNVIHNMINDLSVFLGLKNRQWSTTLFSNLLKKIVNQQPKLNEHILRFSSDKDSNFIIITEIGGAIHSLARILNELHTLKIINNDLKIKTGNYIVFNGNAIGNSPYLLETFSIILKLMEINPTQLFFIKGKYELQDNWKNFGLKKELLFKIKKNPVGKIPLEKNIEAFFHNLPLALYIDIENKGEKYIRISYFNRNFTKLNENNFVNFLNKKQLQKLNSFPLKNSRFSLSPINIMAIINGSNHTTKHGFQLLFPDKGATAWAAISGASGYNNNVFHFKNDAFIILNEKAETIQYYKQDAIKKDGFKMKTFNVFNKIKKEKTNEKINIKETIDTKIDHAKTKDINDENSDDIKIGTTLDLSTSLSEVSKYVLIGLNLKIKELNENGGIHGRKVVLIDLNDRYNPQKALKNIEKLLQQGINTILSPVGSYPLQGYLELAKNKTISIFFPDATSPEYRNNSIRNIVHFLACSGTEGKVITNYLLEKHSPRKIALFYKPEPFSLGALNSAKDILKKHNLIEEKDWIKVQHRPGSIDLDDAVKKIKKFDPEAIILLSSALPNQILINKLKLEYLFNKTILGISSSSGIAFKTFIKMKNLNFTYTQLTPDPKKSDLQIVKEFRNIAELNNEGFLSYTLQGYMIAALFFDIVKKIKGPITNDKILDFIEKIKHYNFKGIELNFNPETRELANSLWLNTGNEIIKVK